MKKSIYLYALLILSLWGCNEAGEFRKYLEITFEPSPQDAHSGLDIASMMLPKQQKSDDPKVQAMLEASMAKVPIKWVSPSHWIESKGSGMRLVTFTSNEKEPVTCTIVTLGGVAGGIKGNVLRWMQQINLSPSQKQFEKFMNSPDSISAPDFDIQIVDLSKLQDSTDLNQESMLAGIIQLDDASIFIKMTGSLRAINKNRKNFEKLCKSIELTNE